MNRRGSLIPLALAGVLALSACVHAPRGDAPPARPLAPPAAAGEHAVSQVVRAAAGPREMSLSCVVSITDGAMSVVGLNALGVRLFTIGYDGRQVRVEKTFDSPEAITPERLIADLQLVYWPLPALREALRAAGFDVSEPAPGTRRLRHGDRLVAEVHYSNAADAWSGRAWLVNLEYGYSLQIDSQPL